MMGRSAWLIAGFLTGLSGTGPWAQEDQWLSPGPSVPDATLHDQDGRAVSLAQLIDRRPVIISFFFTGCAATCPMQTAQLALLQDELDRQMPGSHPLILSISLDPVGDTPASVTNYARNFDIRLGDRENWLMLTGGFDDLRPVWQAFDQGAGAPEDHAGLFWIGQPEIGRWTRVNALADPTELYGLLTEAPS